MVKFFCFEVCIALAVYFSSTFFFFFFAVLKVVVGSFTSRIFENTVYPPVDKQKTELQFQCHLPHYPQSTFE